MRQRLRSVATILGAWTLLALFFLPQTYLLNLRSPSPLSPGWAFMATAALFHVWAVLTPLVLWLGRRFPFERNVLGRRFLVHLAASFCVSALHLAILRYVNLLLMRGTPNYEAPLPAIALLVGYGATNLMIYWGLLGIGQALLYFRRYQDREFRLVEAQLQSLRTQLHPHFLFNTLNAIAELVHQDPRRAERTLTQLSDLLRVALSRSNEHEVTLGEELDFLGNYLSIHHTLLEERLAVRWNVDQTLLPAKVPTMILQPLVENAVRHGIGPRVTGGSIEIAAGRRGGRLELTVRDDGVGPGTRGFESDGVGLPNTRARLQHLYGSAHSFTLELGSQGGVIATMTMPFREEHAP